MPELKWSGKSHVPAVGTRVQINFNGLGPGVVTGYFHAEGYLGVTVEMDPDKIPEWHRKQNPDSTEAHVFGIEVTEEA